MTFLHNNCPNGQFKCDKLSGEYAVNRPNQARAEILDDFDPLAEIPGNSTRQRQKCPVARAKLSR
jgi:hypothetical protein